jgi:plastocyanin
MNNYTSFSRRRFLSASGIVVSLTLAGCTGDETTSAEAENDHDDGHSHDDEDSHDEEDDHSHTHDHDDDHELGHPEAHIEVEMLSEDGHHFLPHVVHVEKGGTVEWVVKSGSHDTKAYHPETHGSQQRIPDDAEPWASDLLSEEGDTFTRTFEIEGVYDYVCTPHEEMGMIGSIIVGWPDPDTQPGLNSPAKEYSETVTEQLTQYNDQVQNTLTDHDS